ncbi:hypothetical protein GDO78_013057 [Eleutherodactylus coqui]|uniref:Uncharacterized protein n=1 Tax=Eleutherodactylus coqui TaxID=57060 RepID=A0A8J6EY29_ELECQ|nr:hypothetical protein GDO78_013057 [Eleutherodactylus coqui]
MSEHEELTLHNVTLNIAAKSSSDQKKKNLCKRGGSVTMDITEPKLQGLRSKAAYIQINVATTSINHRSFIMGNSGILFCNGGNEFQLSRLFPSRQNVFICSADLSLY